mmetsp:Transcript_32834/g.90686  ORF Transcript_32834/g.90686 Transcript_32834/m.90686 type:complete len:252 (-) Transcript_32834:1137-1892(-)
MLHSTALCLRPREAADCRSQASLKRRVLGHGCWKSLMRMWTSTSERPTLLPSCTPQWHTGGHGATETVRCTWRCTARTGTLPSSTPDWACSFRSFLLTGTPTTSTTSFPSGRVVRGCRTRGSSISADRRSSANLAWRCRSARRRTCRSAVFLISSRSICRRTWPTGLHAARRVRGGSVRPARSTLRGSLTFSPRTSLSGRPLRRARPRRPTRRHSPASVAAATRSSRHIAASSPAYPPRSGRPRRASLPAL